MTLIEGIIVVGVVAITALGITQVAGCTTNDSEAIKALDDNGFSDISITDRGAIFAGWEGCGKDDQNYYHASAKNPAGKRVNVLVCCGGGFSFKGCVVRSK
jgi:hypothetical protein